MKTCVNPSWRNRTLPDLMVPSTSSDPFLQTALQIPFSSRLLILVTVLSNVCISLHNCKHRSILQEVFCILLSIIFWDSLRCIWLAASRSLAFWKSSIVWMCHSLFAILVSVANFVSSYYFLSNYQCFSGYSLLCQLVCICTISL